ncbi:unnamed protein product [Rotaria socialis]|uniref:Uncharacterized protein n=1 Tax=Rotaria socialis TaxID=392032 RepID=A0A820W4M5_9BILA|nr:unnamed protein product [Rotaria socialis]CAF4511165.1 unnamed protein product [Rotaria socialis]CAF4527056.1 unnamed protein product [Rotaria socialis]
MASSSNWVYINSNDGDIIHSNEHIQSKSFVESDQSNAVDAGANQTSDSSTKHDQSNAVDAGAIQKPDFFEKTEGDEVYDDAESLMPENDTNKNENENISKTNIANEVMSNTDHMTPQLGSAMRTNFKMHLFMLRYAKSSDKLNLEWHFVDRKFPFAQTMLLASIDNKKLHMFSLELELTRDNFGWLLVLDKNKLHRITTYQLKLSDFDDKDGKRVLRDPLQYSHEFLFDVHFQTIYFQSPPGSDIPFWNQLCLFTCFFLQQSTYDRFNDFIIQFKAAMYGRTFVRDCCEDFFKECNKYVADSLKRSTNKPNGIKQIIRMIGLVPINKQNFGLPNTSTENFTNVIMSEFTKHLKDVISSLAEDEWNSFRDGMVTLICIQLLSQTFKKSNTSPLEVLLNASIQPERLEIIKRLLNFIKNINGDRNIPEPIWFELLVLDSSDNLIKTIPIEIISFEVYVRCATKVVPALAQFDNFINRLSSHFDDAVKQNQFSIDLKNITFLLSFLRNQSSDDANPDLKTIRSIIDASTTLRNKIKVYMSTLNVTINEFNSIRDIFILSNESSVLFHIKRKEFLLKLLTNDKNLRSVDFYTRWFLAFMAPDKNKRSMLDDDEFKELLKVWTKCVAHRPDTIVTILKEINVLISAMGDHPCSSHFIEYMVDLCFQQKSIIEQIEQSVLLVQSPKFLNEFKLKYKTNVLDVYQNSLKELTNQINPLRILIRIDVATKYQHAFLRELIQMACEDIKIDDEEILQDLFYKPDYQTFTYVALFHSSFETIHIRQCIVDRLLAQSLSWEEIGMRWDQLFAWTHYTYQQRVVADKVWALIREVSSKQFEIDKLINTENDKMQEKLKIIEIIPSCLDIYCSNATDKQHYKDLLQNIANSFTEKIVRTVVIPNEIEQFVPIAKRLHPYSKSTVWHLFRQQPLTCK